MFIILRLICENWSRVDVKVNFLSGRTCEHVVDMYIAASFKQVSRRAWKILLPLFCIWLSFVTLSDYKVLILKFYSVPVHLHGVTNFLNQKAISSNHISIFTAKL